LGMSAELGETDAAAAARTAAVPANRRKPMVETFMFISP
jgi:hypothetical protein